VTTREEIDFIYRLFKSWNEEENAVWRIRFEDKAIIVYGPLTLDINFDVCTEEEELRDLRKIEKLIRILGANRLETSWS